MTSVDKGIEIKSSTFPYKRGETYIKEVDGVLSEGSFSISVFSKARKVIREKITLLRIEEDNHIPNDLDISNPALYSWVKEKDGTPVWFSIENFTHDGFQSIQQDNSYSRYILNVSNLIVNRRGGGYIVIPGNVKMLSKLLSFVPSLSNDFGVIKENERNGYIYFKS